MYKNNSKGKVTGARRSVVRNNIANTRSDLDKPFFAMPPYMNKDYQKIKEPMTPEEFFGNFVNNLMESFPNDLGESNDLFTELPDGKHKGESISSFGRDYAEMNYIIWTLYNRRRYKKLIWSILHYNKMARTLFSDPEIFIHHFGEKGLRYDMFVGYCKFEQRKRKTKRRRA